MATILHPVRYPVLMSCINEPHRPTREQIKMMSRRIYGEIHVGGAGRFSALRRAHLIARAAAGLRFIR